MEKNFKKKSKSKNMKEAFVFPKSDIPKAEPVSTRFLIVVLVLTTFLIVFFIIACIILLSLKTGNQGSDLKKDYNQSCQLNDCKSDLICLNGTCVCGNGFSWDGDKCIQIGLFGINCLTNSSCQNDIGLYCNSNICQCDSLVQYWNGSMCTQLKLFNETCTTQSQCKSIQETICSSGSCTCNSTSHYFDSAINKCQLKLNENGSCVQDIQCFGDMICSIGRCSCSNTTTHYFSQIPLLCTSKTLENTVCSISSTCREDIGLSCVAGRCKCNSTNTSWNGIKCEVLTSCSLGWTSYSGSCYYISPQSNVRTYSSARAYCNSQGGTLVIFDSLAEYSFFKTIIPSDKFFIGLDKLSGSWRWLDNSAFDSSMWEPGKPDDDLCGRFEIDGIEDRPCDDEERFVCERK